MSGKCMNSQNIRNIRYTIKAEQNAGRSNENVLIDTSKHLTRNNEQSKVFTLTGDEDNILTAVCFQTGIMRERYEKNGNVLLVDTTYKNNTEGYPLLVFLVGNSMGVGVPVLYAFVRHETADLFNKVCQWVCK